MSARLLALIAAVALAGCATSAIRPADFDAASEACRFCRMTGSDGRTAAQLVAPGEDALFFDDIGCLRDYLRQTSLPAGAVLFVVDHRTREWARADAAVYTFQARLATPMSSHLMAHASTASRAADPDAREGTAIAFQEIFAGVRFGGLY